MLPSFLRYNTDQFQRLGLLKVLVAIMNPQQSSEAKEVLNRKLYQLLYEIGNFNIPRAEQLLRSANSPSWNFAITKSNLSQISEWAKLYGFVGSANQITEKGLLLRYLMGADAISSISRGDFSINPFELTLEEKLYFLFVQLQIDTTIYFLIQRLSAIPNESVIGGINANKLTCLAFFDTFKLISGSKSGSGSLLLLKNLRELIGKMVVELDLSSEVPIRPIMKPRLSIAPRQKPEQRNKKRTKTSDHETIPRFELLTDLGLLVKKSEEEDDKEKSLKAWKYWVTPLLLSFSRMLPNEFKFDLCHTHFAQVSGVFIPAKLRHLSIEEDPLTVARRVYSAYAEIKRRFGNISLESVAIIAMIRSLANLEVLEIKQVHELFLTFKKKGLFSETVRFAAGNELDRMFVDIRPSFIEEVEKFYGNAK